MIWTHEEAAVNEVSQMSVSGCGVTALANVLVALGAVDRQGLHSIDWSVCALRRRAEDASLPVYLASRGIAGCTGAELVQSMNTLQESGLLPSNFCIGSRFYSFAEIASSSKSVMDFIEEHIVAGHVPVATMNLQLVGNDAWHHQMIYGIDRNLGEIHCVNPTGPITETLFQRFISTPSVLAVRRQDIIKRIDRPTTHEEEDATYNRPDWMEFGVREQIQMMIQHSEISHVIIPANYVGGISVFERSIVQLSSTATAAAAAAASDAVSLENDEESIHEFAPLFSSCQSFRNNQRGVSIKIHTRNLSSMQSTESTEYCPSLFVDDIWPGARMVADFLLEEFPHSLGQYDILELGAGGALPSLICCTLGARLIAVTDYPVPSVLANIHQLFVENKLIREDEVSVEDLTSIALVSKSPRVVVGGHDWGDEATMRKLLCYTLRGHFNILILAELLWKDTYHKHRSLLSSVKMALIGLPSNESESRNESHRQAASNTVKTDYEVLPMALVSFAHRPTATHTPGMNDEFFVLAREEFGLSVELLKTSNQYCDVGEEYSRDFVVFLYKLTVQE